MKAKRVVRPQVPVAPASVAVALQILAGLVFILLMSVPWTLTATGPLDVRVIDSDKDPVRRACVTESWPAYTGEVVRGAKVDTLTRTASATLRADSAGLVHFPLRTATANGWQRLAAAVPRLITRVFGGTPKPTVVLTVLGPGYQGQTANLTPVGGAIPIPIRTDVQSPALQARFSRSCVP